MRSLWQTVWFGVCRCNYMWCCYQGWLCSLHSCYVFLPGIFQIFIQESLIITPLYQKTGATYSERDLPASPPGYKGTWLFKLGLRIRRVSMYTPVGAGPDLKISPSYSSKTEKALFPTTPHRFLSWWWWWWWSSERYSIFKDGRRKITTTIFLKMFTMCGVLRYQGEVLIHVVSVSILGEPMTCYWEVG